MGPPNARTTSVSPSSGADFEMPFKCGQAWTGTSRSGHSPSYYTIDWNRTDDLGQPVLASAPGVVTRAVSLTSSYGRHVIVDHGGGYTTLYAHLNSIASTVGQVVEQGDLIGYLGTSGNSTGPHLHHEQRLNGAYFAPYFHRARYTHGYDEELGQLQRPSGCRRLDRGRQGRPRRLPDRSDHRPVAAEARQRDDLVRVGPPGRPAARRQLRWRPQGRGGHPAPRGHQLRAPLGPEGTRIAKSAGRSTDMPLTGDWDGNGRTELGLYRPSTHQFLRQISGTWKVVTWGGSGQQPVTGDWNKDGRADVGTFNMTNGSWTLRVPTNGKYPTKRFTYGRAGDRPVIGDFNGDRIDDAAVWRPSNGTFYLRLPKAGGGVTSKLVPFGLRR